MPLKISPHPAYAKHFLNRLWERYGLLLDRHAAYALAQELSSASKQGSNKHQFIGNHDDPGAKHQEVWNVLIETKWTRVIYDPISQRMVTAVPFIPVPRPDRNQ